MLEIMIGEGAAFCINDEGHLTLNTRKAGKITNEIDIGPATAKRFAQLQTYLNRLKVHAVEEKIL